ncbi:MAG: hypothetical protein RML32_00025, partial [Gammaproteobacteria bacterium]|nr:hypothetical protein [Gammaproteobacteria bacterium]
MVLIKAAECRSHVARARDALALADALLEREETLSAHERRRRTLALKRAMQHAKVAWAIAT